MSPSAIKKEMWPAQIGRNKRQRDACQRSSAADADRRPEGGGSGGGNRTARTNTRAHVVGEAMPHPRERRGWRRESEVPPRNIALRGEKKCG